MILCIIIVRISLIITYVQIGDLCECFAAIGAHVWSQIGVNTFMIAKICCLSESYTFERKKWFNISTVFPTTRLTSSNCLAANLFGSDRTDISVRPNDFAYASEEMIFWRMFLSKSYRFPLLHIAAHFATQYRKNWLNWTIFKCWKRNIQWIRKCYWNCTATALTYLCIL